VIRDTVVKNLTLITNTTAGIFPSFDEWETLSGGVTWDTPAHKRNASECVMEKGKFPPTGTDSKPPMSSNAASVHNTKGGQANSPLEKLVTGMNTYMQSKMQQDQITSLQNALQEKNSSVGVVSSSDAASSGSNAIFDTAPGIIIHLGASLAHQEAAFAKVLKKKGKDAGNETSGDDNLLKVLKERKQGNVKSIELIMAILSKSTPTEHDKSMARAICYINEKDPDTTRHYLVNNAIKAYNNITMPSSSSSVSPSPPTIALLTWCDPEDGYESS
jgi:hypothetical protein